MVWYCVCKGKTVNIGISVCISYILMLTILNWCILCFVNEHMFLFGNRILKEKHLFLNNIVPSVV